ncbi:DAK2 domain-containing protein [Malacoplasma penetrans]|uniref:DAK2 domain-containing protein n=1 Tax=Malacoplasma penetrans TaxID=28227 RepID=UPI00101090AC|nr:DAK2 domain-containing protein [Malacoplasma penetrans]RXY97211.1 DAK2 domain-containing protein [Malacoplasma penetrans]
MKSLETKILVSMFENGAKEIAKHYEYINELNVFPVPDGDTGTNMKITATSAVEALNKQLPELGSIYEVGKFFCRQLLMNARGNSGVIFSQIIRGFFEPIEESTKKLTIELIVRCFISAKEKAYKSISNPVEGTILTIIREISEQLPKENINDVEELFKKALTIGLNALEKTPEILPSLKETKVVDSGGYGLCKFLEGMYNQLVNSDDDNVQNKDIEIEKKKETVESISVTSKNTFIQSKVRNDISEEGFGYCCEFIIQKDFITHEKQPLKIKFDLNKFEKEMLLAGESLVVVDDSDIVKVHIHSITPSLVFEIGQKYGEFLKLKVENMTLQYIESHPGVSPSDLFNKFSLTDDVQIVATCPSRKIADYLKNEFGINNVIVTEETGNPSTNEIMNQIINCKSRNILVLTDDSNIILSAEQAATFMKERYDVVVLKSKNIIEVINACLVFSSEKSISENARVMNRAIRKQDSAMLSVSVKTSKFNGVHVEKNDFIGIYDKKIVLAEKNSEIAITNLIKKLRDRNKKAQLLYIVYGQGVTLREIRNIEKFANENYGIKCKLIDGGQKIYRYFIGMS